MMRKSNIIVENLLQKRYNEKYLVEKLDDGGMPTRSGKAKKAEDIQRDYVDWAYENIPGVKGMAQVEVPLASKNKKEYETLRTELAKEIVKARKAAFDKKESADEKEILLRALGENPQLANVLTRDEYESIAGEITNPLELNFEVQDETGAKTPKSISLPKWSGIEDNSAMLYDFLRGAQHSLTTPEGLATAGAYGAAFRGLGLGAGALGRVLGPKLAKYVPGLVKQATKVTLPKIAGKPAEAVGQALGQQAVNVTGLGLMGLGGLQAAQQGKFSRYAGELAGGVAPFAAGSKAVDVAVPAAAKGLPIAYAKGKEAATAVGDIAKGTGESLAQLGKKVGSDISGAAQDVKNLTVKDLLANLKAGLTPSGLDFSYKIRRINPSDAIPNLSAKEIVAKWKKGEPGDWTPGQEIPPNIQASRSSTTPSTGQPTSLAGRAAAAVTAIGVGLGSAQTSSLPMRGAEVGARVGAIETRVGAPKVETSPFKVDLSGSGGRATSETKAKATQTTPAASTAKATPAAASQGVRTFAQVDAVKKLETTKVGQEKPSEDVPGKEEEKAKDQTGQDQKKETKDTTTDQAKQRNVDYIRNTIGSVGPGGPPLAPPNRVPEPPPPGKGGGGGGLPGFGMGGMPQGSPISDYEMKRQMAGTDINAILQNLFQTARTVTIG
jgi:hypothetical protein